MLKLDVPKPVALFEIHEVTGQDTELFRVTAIKKQGLEAYRVVRC
jgi:hypothetical protein